ncbi:adenosine deaminase [Gordonia sp. HNM0687]|uniref:Adenosine deaminase n=1 Tax=Gordonia mangrovi TaxID=2665643 RepID=A0A6L7GUE5_9ACTN|nr:adenosine deaminase [Gordonia mangrovi]MXP23087.1 adenosine deaminase [Gordonia mangrovi]UVF77374.1 adenosine deaminase [Gordonia mangrovi]
MTTADVTGSAGPADAGPGRPLDLPNITLAPKVLLHDHLDGGLRPSTVLELAHETGYADLPADDPDELADWFRDAADSGSLERYLETFAHTVAVMQTPAALARVARECVEDLAADGVVYAEVRYAPEQHLEQGLTLDEVVEAVLEGFAQGQRDAAEAGRPIIVRCLVTAMRHAARSREIAELAVRFRDAGVVGFDIAGAEAGNPPTRHLDAFEFMRANNAHFTIHAGEAFGLPSIHEAIAFCGTDRLGHGVRVIDDITLPTGADLTAESFTGAELGQVANIVRDKRIPLELCPSSNVQTGAVASMADHPFNVLARLRFRVTVNTDNRLMSDTTMSKEFLRLSEQFGYGWADFERFTVNAMKSAFIHFDERLALIDDVIKPGYAVLLG